MQRHTMQKNKRLLVVLASLLAIAVLAGGSMAYFTTEGTARSQITASNVRVKLVLEEERPDGTLAEAPESMAANPGASASRIARATNVGNEPFWVRAKVAVVANGEEVKDDATLMGTSDAWTFADGYWYYAHPLEAGTTSEPVFAGIAFAPTMGNDYAGAEVRLDVDMQATQQAHNGASALEAAGWPSEQNE